MPRELPNLDWLRVFAATAATESFALAAGELNVTPGAVSQRIKALEAYLGVELFQRYPQGVRLTDVGRRYAQRVLPPLEQLTLATREILSPKSAKSIRLTALPALAQLWLGHRIEEFHKAHANTTIEIWADPAIVDLRTSNFDMAIRYGRPPFPGCDHRELLFDELVPIAAPSLLRSSPLDEQGLPVGMPLFLDTYWANDFDDWLRHTGHIRPANLVTHTFSLYSMVIEATLNGRGFMVGHTSVVSDLIAEGRLQPLSERRVTAGNQFYLLTKAGSPLSDIAAAFIDWILDQAKPTPPAG
ncbi:LysR substrate-binding domain-containing protein [Sphingopyxis sp.]|jgi:LysR family glycine cleavage system transcriptional activator|uniref:LysR substrate-binding domain-containing protein n=1 Tax=Sphingopyxis sp. TaxID=1908224 RepID=UPI0025CFF04B|nr:LysR substrate-binding domain-containing protein [Sphingopyxis sp.]MBK6413443.1 LysR family transcriptional regulator [Sphingopyxis sp.]